MLVELHREARDDPGNVRQRPVTTILEVVVERRRGDAGAPLLAAGDGERVARVPESRRGEAAAKLAAALANT
jgi:hypothetical protein